MRSGPDPCKESNVLLVAGITIVLNTSSRMYKSKLENPNSGFPSPNPQFCVHVVLSRQCALLPAQGLTGTCLRSMGGAGCSRTRCYQTPSSSPEICTSTMTRPGPPPSREVWRPLLRLQKKFHFKKSADCFALRQTNTTLDA